MIPLKNRQSNRNREEKMDPTRKKLLEAARDARKKAYAPYSRFRVGAAVLSGSGRIYTGSNVENASYGLTCCAERSAIFAMISAGEKKIAGLLIIGDSKEFLPPCGACRQVIAEFAGPRTWVSMCDRSGKCREIAFSDLMPYRFFLSETPK
jgi:cytidine deaminase